MSKFLDKSPSKSSIDQSYNILLGWNDIFIEYRIKSKKRNNDIKIHVNLKQLRIKYVIKI